MHLDTAMQAFEYTVFHSESIDFYKDELAPRCRHWHQVITTYWKIIINNLRQLMNQMRIIIFIE